MKISCSFIKRNGDLNVLIQVGQYLITSLRERNSTLYLGCLSKVFFFVKKSMRTLYLNGSIATNKDGYSKLASLYKDIIDHEDVNVEINFSRVTWFEANLCSVLGAIRQKAEKELGFSINLTAISPSLRGILCRNGFLACVNYGLVDFKTETVVTFQEFAPEHAGAFNNYLQRELLVKKDFPRHSSMLGKGILSNIFEVFENARTHGECKWIYTCGQHYPHKQPARFDITIVDIGRTIHKNVNDFHNGQKNFSPSEAIEWAIQSGNTTKKNQTGGLGLGLLKEFIHLNQGKIQIVSSFGFWEFKDGKTIREELNYYFPGTIVTIEFNFNDPSFYMLKGEPTITMDDIF